SVRDACEFFILHRLLAFPVVDERRRVLGIVDMELYTDELGRLGEASSREDLFQLLGVHQAPAPVGSPWAAFRHRFPWLGCNLTAGILAALLAGAFESELNREVALAFFIPVVLNLAESVSSQSVSASLLALHGGRVSWSSLLGGLPRELLTG